MGMRGSDESQSSNEHGVQFGEVHRLQHLHGCLQERMDQPRGRRVHVVEQCGNQARNRLPQALGKPGRMARWLGAEEWEPEAPLWWRSVYASEPLLQPAH